MARTRRRYRSRFKRRRVSHRGSVRKRARRYRFSRKRTFRRRVGGKGRRTGVRRFGRRKFGRGTLFKSPASKTHSKFLTLKTAVRAISFVPYQAVESGNPPAMVEKSFYSFTNTIGLFGSSHLSWLVEKPDIFPPTGHNGLFLVFSLDTYIRAMCGSFFGFRNTKVLESIGPTTYGVKGLQSENEIALRKAMIEHTRTNLYKIGVRFIRRAGRSTANSSVVAGYKTPSVNTVAVDNQGTMTGVIGSGALGVGDMVTKVNTDDILYIPNTGGELPFYSQNVEYLTSPWQLYERLRSGIPASGSDQITGPYFSSGIARYARLLNEMVSGREWRKQSGIRSLHFSIGKKKQSGDFLRVKYGAAGVMSDLTVGSGVTNDPTNASYSVAGDMKNFPSGSNAFESYCSTLKESAIFQDGRSDNVCTLPAIDGPRGSIVIWIPYSIQMFNALYDVEIYGKYRFSNGSMSSLDLPMFMGDTDVVML